MVSFTQLDLIKGYVTYRHNDSNNLIDTFNFIVHAKDVHLDAGVHVHIYLESHQWPPRVVNKNNLLVEEGKPVKISKGKLQVNCGVHFSNLVGSFLHCFLSYCSVFSLSVFSSLTPFGLH